MSNGTYIKLYRKFLDWEWYEDTNCVRLFLHLLLKANWEDSEYKGSIIPRGSIVVGRRALAQQLGLSERQIRTTINRLEKCHTIDQRSTKQFTVISICHFDTYNSKETSPRRKTTNDRPTSDQRSTTSKEDKKIRRKEKDSFFEGIDLNSLPQRRLTGELKTIKELQADALIAKKYGKELI